VMSLTGTRWVTSRRRFDVPLLPRPSQLRLWSLMLLH